VAFYGDVLDRDPRAAAAKSDASPLAHIESRSDTSKAAGVNLSDSERRSRRELIVIPKKKARAARHTEGKIRPVAPPNPSETGQHSVDPIANSRSVKLHRHLESVLEQLWASGRSIKPSLMVPELAGIRSFSLRALCHRHEGTTVPEPFCGGQTITTREIDYARMGDGER